MSESNLQPPRRTHNERIRDGEYRHARQDRHLAAWQEALTGRGDFWPTGDWSVATQAPKWDNEQQCAIMVAVRDALARQTTSARRWEMVIAAVCRELEPYCAAKADEAQR